MSIVLVVDSRKRTTVYLTADQQSDITRLGVTLAEVIRAGLASLGKARQSAFVITLRRDGTYSMRPDHSPEAPAPPSDTRPITTYEEGDGV